MAVYGGPDIVTDGLVLYLDAGNSKSYPGSGTAWTDLSGGQNHSTLTNGPTYSSSGNGSIVFDGNDDYVDTNKYFDNIFTGTQSFSILCWLNPASTQVQYADIWGNHAGSTGNESKGIVLQQNNFATNQYLFAYGDNTTFRVTSTFNLTANTYSQLLLTKNSTHTSIYVNTTRLVYNNLPQAISPTTSLTFRIGIGYRISRYWKGNIGNFSIYNKELNLTEISQNFNALKGRFGL